jgi:ABC-2 type transport system permease protein
VFKKELRHILRDKGTLRVGLMIPIVQLLLFGFIDQTVHDVATVVVDQDHSVESRLLISQMQAAKTFKITRVTTSPDEAREEIRSGRARVGVLIPAKFRDNRLRRDDAQVGVLIDGSDSTVSAQALAAVNGLVAEDAARSGVVNPTEGLSARPLVLFNPEGRTANYIIPGLAAVLMQIFGMIFAAGAIARERERGTFEQLLVTPIHPLGLMLGKLFPYLFLCFFEVTMILALMRFGFSVPIKGSLLFALLSLGLLLSSRANSVMEAQQSAQLFMLPAMFLSGYIFPFEGLPAVLKAIGLVFPVTHMIAIMRGIVLRDANAFDLWPSVAALLFISVVLIGLGAKSIHKVAA